MNLFLLAVRHFLHILATIVWIGGIILILFVVIPEAKTSLESKSMVNKLIKNIGRRFTILANTSIFLIIITGIILLIFDKNSDGFFNVNKSYNIVISVKHFFVVLMILIHFYRGLILNPKISKVAEQTIETTHSSSISSKVSRLKIFSLNLVKTNFILGIVVLLLAGVTLSL